MPIVNVKLSISKFPWTYVESNDPQFNILLMHINPSIVFMFNLTHFKEKIFPFNMICEMYIYIKISIYTYFLDIDVAMGRNIRDFIVV